MWEMHIQQIANGVTDHRQKRVTILIHFWENVVVRVVHTHTSINIMLYMYLLLDVTQLDSKNSLRYKGKVMVGNKR